MILYELSGVNSQQRMEQVVSCPPISLRAPEAWHANVEKAQLPSVFVRGGWSKDYLCIHFQVHDSELTFRCVCTQDQEPVWQDSCCEVFVACSDGRYLNVECNPKGIVLSARGFSRENRTPLQPEELKTIQRICHGSSLERSLLLEIPLSLLGYATWPQSLQANAYKCGDQCSLRHWLVLSDIPSAKPDFHRPEYFTDWVRRATVP